MDYGEGGEGGCGPEEGPRLPQGGEEVGQDDDEVYVGEVDAEGDVADVDDHPRQGVAAAPCAFRTCREEEQDGACGEEERRRFLAVAVHLAYRLDVRGFNERQHEAFNQ